MGLNTSVRISEVYRTALNVSGRGEKIGTDGDEKQVIYITWPHQSFLSTINAVRYTLTNPNRGV